MGALNNNIDVVVGARSALFLPFSNLGLIIVDEEHDGSYKQEESIIYNARDMSVVRAKIENIPIVLASATPSIETLTNGFTGKYEHIRLPYRFGSSRLPSISLVDMRMEKAKWFSERLLSEIKKTISNGEQVLLYINRRGYAPLTVCKSCGEKILCPNCSVSLVEHKSIKSLVCHYCNHMIKKPSECLSCKSQDLISWGPGIEQIYDEIKKIFHNSNVAIASSDTLSTTNKMNVFVEDVLNKKVDIIVGTQILAKGHHFPDLTLIGVIDSDAGLDSTDLRSSEKIFQMLYQVSGRAGREEKIGSVIIQTYKPEHPLYKSLVNLDRENFINEEISVRRISKMPPFTRLVAIIFSGNDARQVEETAKNFVRVSPDDDRIMVLGPAPAVLLRIRGKTRWRVLIKFSKECKLQDILDVWLKCVKNISSVRIKIDVDPLNFL